MSNEYIYDLRSYKGVIWDVKSILDRFPLDDFINCVSINQNNIDRFIYEGFTKYGENFIRQLNGKFASVYYDQKRKRLFLTRDWLGEVPLHYLVTSKGIYIANTILEIKKRSGSEYDFNHIKAFPHSTSQSFELDNVDLNNFENSIRPISPEVYYNFSKGVREFQRTTPVSVPNILSEIRTHIIDSTEKRASLYPKSEISLLLSGGLDSLTIAIVLKKLGLNFTAYTLSTGDITKGDVSRAMEIAKQLNIKHRIINIEKNLIRSSFRKAIEISESYHLFNVYCALGMMLLGDKLKDLGVRMAFSGEAVNEAVGDYKDWKVYHPIEKREVVLQAINQNRIEKSSERILYVWGNLINNSKYNRQLGSGLAKHAGARMIKPFLDSKIELENPYYDLNVLGRIVSLTGDQLNKIGKKPGLLWGVFSEDFKTYGITKKQVNQSTKVRLQDNTEKGEGITSILLEYGFDQKKAIEIFNDVFNANLDVYKNSKRLMNL